MTIIIFIASGTRVHFSITLFLVMSLSPCNLVMYSSQQTELGLVGQSVT